MQKIMTLRVHVDKQEPQEVDVMMRHTVMWEKAYRGRSIQEIVSGNLSATALYELAHTVLAKTKGYQGNFASFMESADVEIVAEDEEDPKA